MDCGSGCRSAVQRMKQGAWWSTLGFRCASSGEPGSAAIDLGSDLSIPRRLRIEVRGMLTLTPTLRRLGARKPRSRSNIHACRLPSVLVNGKVVVEGIPLVEGAVVCSGFAL